MYSFAIIGRVRIVVPPVWTACVEPIVGLNIRYNPQWYHDKTRLAGHLVEYLTEPIRLE